MSERILLIGDPQRELHASLVSARPGASVMAVGNIFDGIAELAARSYTTVLAPAEPIERRPESAVRTLREVAGATRLLLYGHPTLEPLSRKMLGFGIDDYLVMPAIPGDLLAALSCDIRHVAMSPAAETGSELSDPSKAESATMSSGKTLPTGIVGEVLREIPLAAILMESLFHSPHDVLGSTLSKINAALPDGLKIVFSPGGAAAPAAVEDLVRVSQTVPALESAGGMLHCCAPTPADTAGIKAFLTELSELASKALALQERHCKLQKLAITDELTGLYNGRYFRHFLNRIIDKARQMRFPVTLLLFDIDNFKRYNDQYGHGMGDEILRQTAALMKRCVRDHDLVARMSGDEFAVVFWEKEGPRQPRDGTTGAPGRPPQTPVEVLERFRRLLATQDFRGLGSTGQGTLTISGGLAVYPYDAQSANDLINSADQALMFKAKKSGKNSIYLVGGQEASASNPA